MALELNNFIGFETGDLNEALATAGGAAVNDAEAQSGQFSLVVNGASDQYSLAIITGGTTDANDDFIVGFWFFKQADPTSVGRNFFQVRDDSGTLIWNLRIGTNGNLEAYGDGGATQIGPSITDPFTVNTWHLVEIRWQHLNSGLFDLHIDNDSKISVTNADCSAGGVISEDLAEYRFETDSFAGTFYRADDVYCFSGASGVADFLGNAQIFRYQGNTNSATGDLGAPLDTGVWQDLGETPVSSDATEPSYTQASLGSAIFTDDTQSGDNFRPGPSGDSEITGAAIQGAKWLHRLRRTGGSATQTNKERGNNVDGLIRSQVTLGTSYANFFTVSETGEVPTSTQFFAQGFSRGSAGNRDILCQEIFAFLLVVPSTEVPAIRPMDQLHPRAARRPSPLAFWIDNLLAVPEEVFTVIRPMPQLLPLTAARAAPMSYWIPNELAVPELDFPPIRPMPQLHPRAAPRAAPLHYWISNRLPPEPAPPIRGMDQLHPRARRRAAPRDYWIDNLLAAQEFPPIQPMPQLLPQARRRAAPYTYWLDNWLAVEELVQDLPPGIQMQVRVFRVNRASPLSYMIQGLIAVQIEPPPVGVAGARGNQADTMVIAVFV